MLLRLWTSETSSALQEVTGTTYFCVQQARLILEPRGVSIKRAQRIARSVDGSILLASFPISACNSPSSAVATMAGSSNPTWHPLPASHKGIPSLLVSTSFTPTPASYTVHITDLANIWVETLDRRGIIRRSLDENTTIDPSEDADNMRAFLDKLQAAFQQDHDDHNTTSLSLSVSDKEDAGLQIHVTCVLPGNLKPLRWPMHLKRCPPSSVATELVLPLIQAQQTRAREVAALMDALRDKDAVITKLVDKLEASGTGLEHIFNSLSGRRKVTRALAEDRVKGLAPFKESSFKANSTGEDGEDGVGGNLPDLIDTVFGGAGLRYRTDMDICDSPQLDDWWTKLGTGSRSAVPLAGKKKDVAKTASTPPPPSKPADDADEFQVQSTPPHLTSARKRSPVTRPSVPGDDDTTDDDEDTSQIPDSHPPPRASQAAQAPSSKTSRFGTIGGKRKPEAPPAPPSPPRQVAQTQGDDDDDTTASGSDDEPAPSPPPKQAKKGGLGRIGGKAKDSPPAPARSASPKVEESGQASKPAKGKLGHIGKNATLAERPQSHVGSGDDERGRPSTKAEVVEDKPRETSEERADRKRTELQKELERKAAAGPAKKKRKF